MLVPALVTITFFPVYLLVRSAYFALPLHIDTGFYVSNHTVATRRIRYSMGWNTEFAGCSKVVPELFYSLVYLFTTRVKCGNGCAYKHNARIAAAFYNYISAIAVAVLAAVVLGGGTACYVVALIAFALLSSEPQYGVYYECGELFEVPWHALSVILLVVGIEGARGDYIALSAFIWISQSCFIKLSSLLAFPILFGGAAIFSPAATAPILFGAATAGLLFCIWMRVNGRGPLRMFGSLVGHEVSFGQRADARIIAHRVQEKCRMIARTIRAQPVVPCLAGLALLAATVENPVFWLYALAVIAVYFAQSTNCWYYQIPLQPIFCILATSVILEALASSTFAVLPIFAGVVWIVHNTVWAARLDTEALYKWCWNGHLSCENFSANLKLEKDIAEIGPIVRDQALLVYGPLTQSYVLARTAYQTPLIAPADYLDDMQANWQERLNRQILEDPPAFVLDTANCFDANASQRGLGLCYVDETPANCANRLYRYDRRANECNPDYQTRTFRAGSPRPDRSPAELHREPPSGESTQSAARLEALLGHLHKLGHRRLAIYGAGRFTVRHAQIYRRSPVPIVMVFDDRAERFDGRFLDWPVARTQESTNVTYDAVVVSTDRFTNPMKAKARSSCPKSVKIYAATEQLTWDSSIDKGDYSDEITPDSEMVPTGASMSSISNS